MKGRSPARTDQVAQWANCSRSLVLYLARKGVFGPGTTRNNGPSGQWRFDLPKEELIAIIDRETRGKHGFKHKRTLMREAAIDEQVSEMRTRHDAEAAALLPVPEAVKDAFSRVPAMTVSKVNGPLPRDLASLSTPPLTTALSDVAKFLALPREKRAILVEIGERYGMEDLDLILKI